MFKKYLLILIHVIFAVLFVLANIRKPLTIVFISSEDEYEAVFEFFGDQSDTFFQSPEPSQFELRRDGKRESRGEGFIVSKQKNLYFDPVGEDKGSVINFLAKIKGTDLRSAASELKSLFLDKPKEKEETKLPEYELHYDKWLEGQNITEEETNLGK